jgi:hypothetical protein
MHLAIEIVRLDLKHAEANTFRLYTSYSGVKLLSFLRLTSTN